MVRLLRNISSGSMTRLRKSAADATCPRFLIQLSTQAWNLAAFIERIAAAREVQACPYWKSSSRSARMQSPRRTLRALCTLGDTAKHIGLPVGRQELQPRTDAHQLLHSTRMEELSPEASPEFSRGRKTPYRSTQRRQCNDLASARVLFLADWIQGLYDPKKGIVVINFFIRATPPTGSHIQDKARYP